MSTAQVVETNMVDTTGVSVQAQKQAYTGSSDFYDTMAAITSYTAPAAYESFALTGNDVVAASINASVNSYGYGTSSSTGYNPYVTASLSSSSSYGSSLGTVTRSDSSSTLTTDVISEQLYEGQVQSMEMLVLQNEVATGNRTWQIASTVASNSEQTKMAMVRNMKS